MHTHGTSTDAGNARMSHRHDPDTSHEAAKRARTGRKVVMIRGAILGILSEHGPLTAREIHRHYEEGREPGLLAAIPDADLLDIRRRLTELKLDERRVVDTGTRRNGQAVMGLAEEVAA